MFVFVCQHGCNRVANVQCKLRGEPTVVRVIVTWSVERNLEGEDGPEF